VANRPFLSALIILLGLVMICAGYGYTVNRVSVMNYGEPGQKATVHVSPIRDMDKRRLKHDSLLMPHDSILKKSNLEPIPNDLTGVVQSSPKSTKVVPTSFFFPAIILLSGTVLCAAGAIALIHRRRGIGTN